MKEGTPAFVVDVMLGRLARGMRLLGLDTVFVRRRTVGELQAAAREDRRVLVTRDRRLAPGDAFPGGIILIEATDWRRQLAEFVAKSGCRPFVRPFTRCLACNGRLADSSAVAVGDDAPRSITARHRHFRRCTDCGRVYWPGSHQPHLHRTLRQLGLENPPEDDSP
jgi:uncharacterized protein with PIN domain